MDEPTAEIWSFPTDISQFDDDTRISFSKLDRKYIAVGEDGAEYEFEAGLKRWVPILDEELIAAQQAAYGTAEDPSSRPPQHGKKRKQDSADYHHEDSRSNRNGGGKSSRGGRGNKNNGGGGNSSSSNKRPRNPPAPKQNTAIYVTGLPPDATAEEVAELFSRKCGVIAEEIDSGRPRVKLYTDAEGRFKGDALIVFFKPQSVDMAIMLLDDTEFRLPTTGGGGGSAAADGGDGAGRMRVMAADASYKKTNYAEQQGAAAAAAAAAPPADDGGRGIGPVGGGGGGSGPGGARTTSEQDKQKIIKKTQKLSAKLADWSDDEPGYADPLLQPEQLQPPSRSSSKWDKVVILKHMFTLAELEADPAALLDIKEDVREECEKLGEVTNVVLYDREPEGVVSVRFRRPESALACVRLMDGRAFDGRIVEAAVATGRDRFRKSGKKGAEDEEEGGAGEE